MILGENIGSVYSEGKEIQRVYSKGMLVWEKEPIDYTIIPFTVKAVDDNVNVRVLMDKDSGSVKYTFNGVDWNIIDETTDIHLNINDTISITTTNIRRIVIKGLSDVYGNIMSLEYGDNFIGQTVWVGRNVDSSYGLFYNTDIRSAKNLILPATTLAEGAYRAMFADCSSLTKAPSLPATTLSPSCYHSMFAGCSNLTTTPSLPATVMTESCYEGMFMDCSSLTTAPNLPSTTLASGCYRNMFYGCSSLTKAPSLPATTLADRCYPRMFYGCSSLTTAPDLPATKLTAYCYTLMFAHCSKLNYIKCYATSAESNINISYVFSDIIYPDEVWENWTTGVAPNGVFVCKSKLATTLKQYIPSTWTVEYFT